MTVYEFPLNERIRTWLRLEDLFGKAAYFIQAQDFRSHHAGLLAIFEIVEVTARSELKNELIQELDRQKNSLEILRRNPAVDATRLEDVLAGLARALSGLLAMTGKLGQHVRDNEWLSSIKGRASIPGGVCSFDLPVYHYWLNQADEDRKRDLAAWLSPMLPVKKAVDVVLRILREGGRASSHTATQGSFQLMLAGRSAHMLRVAVNASCAPEVSANKYAVNIRFLVPDTAQKPRLCDRDVSFDLTFCNL
ncbi:MAG TPA: cell division protein ZapD [Thiobacillaceae bacterium]|nr:cell division protein ZapD [Thiobacillaceae bacterium]HNU64698.1 cell division protein ZapD [Thiobacillaceae bacterium]